MGGVGGICAVLVGHPFDLVKVRLQTAEKGVYTGAIDVVKRTIAREGLARVCQSHPGGTRSLFGAPERRVIAICSAQWLEKDI